MAKLEDVLQYLTPDLAAKTLNAIKNPSNTGTKILSAIKDFDAIEAADFIKETIADQIFSPNFEDIAITEEGGFGGGTDTSGILSQVGDIALNKLGLPINTENVKDIFTDTGTEGGIRKIAEIGFDLIKRMGKEKAMRYAETAFGVNSPVLAFIMRTPVGANLRTMGGDVLGMTGIPDAYNFLLNKGKNILGFDVNAPDPIINTSQPGVIDQYVASLNQPNVVTNDDGTQTLTGGTSDPSDDITVTNLPPQVHRPTMADVAGPSTPTPTPSWPNTPPPGYTPTRPRHYAFAQGGLASMAHVLRR